MFNKLVKLANKLDNIGQYKIAEYIDLLIKIAAKADRLKEQYPKLSQNIDELNERDPSPTKKYLEWAVKQFNTGLYTIDEVGNAIKQFHMHHQKLENKDINSYKTVEEVERALVGKDIPSKRQMKEISKSGADTIYESPNYIVIHPKTKDAVCTYGAGTKWCITMKDQSHFEYYASKGIVFYYILDRHPKDDVMNKVAIAFNALAGTGVYEVFDAKDREIGMAGLYYHYGDEWPAIETAIKTHSKTEGMKSAEEYMMDKAINGSDEEKEHMAYSSNTPTAILSAMLKNERDPEQDRNIQIGIAGNPNTSVDDLALLAKKYSFAIRYAVARNYNTPKEILALLAHETRGMIRAALAQNYHTPPEALDMIANDNRESVKYHVAENPNTMPETLAMLSKEKSESIRRRVAKNPNTPDSILNILKTDKIGEVGLAAIHNIIDKQKTMSANQASRKSKLQKLSQQLQNLYFPIGQKGDEYGGEADQESEVPEEINDEMEAKDMENYIPGQDNLIIDKNNNPTDGLGILGKLSKRDILLKSKLMLSMRKMK